MSSPIVYIKGTRLSLVERSLSRILSCFASKSVSFFTVVSWVEIQSHVILPFFLPEIFHFESCDFACFVFPPLSPLLSSAWIALLSVQGVFDRDQVYLLVSGRLLHFYQVSSYFVFSKYCIVVRLYFIPRLHWFSGILSNFVDVWR